MRKILLVLVIILGVLAKAGAQVITVGPQFGAISACAGSPSFSPYIINFAVSGISLTGNITATAPTNFEISLNADNGYGAGVTIAPVAGIVNNVTIYVRSSATSASGNIVGNVVISTPGVTDETMLVKGYVSEQSTVNAVNNQTVTSGTAISAINFTGNANTFTWTNDMPGIGLPATGSGDIASFIPVNTTASPITATITATPHFAGFAYVPDISGKLYVINTITNTITSTISAPGFISAIAISPDKKRIYASVDNLDEVVVFDAVTKQRITEISVLTPLSVGSYRSTPQTMVLSPDGSMLYVGNVNTDPSTQTLSSPNNTVSVINTATNMVVATIQMNRSAPMYMAISPDSKFVYTTNGITRDITVISTATNTIVKNIPTSSISAGIVVSNDGRFLYVGSSSLFVYVTIIDPITGAEIKEIQVSTSPAYITLSPDGSLLYAGSVGDKTISVINMATNTIIATIPTVDIRGLSVSGDGSLLYTINLAGLVSVYSAITYQLVAQLTVNQSSELRGNFVTPGINCSGAPITFTITVNPGPAIVATGSLPPLTTTYGTPSAAASFTVSGRMLNEGILVTPPPGFEVSPDGTNFSKTLTIGKSGTVPNTTVYIRLAATAKVGSYSGDVVLTSAKAPDATMATSNSTVTRASLIVVADDETKMYGYDNPALTISYKGFVNNEGAADLTTRPTAITTAESVSAVGQYPITVSGAASPNYSFAYVSGTLTVTPLLTIPNTFTPNNDGINDTWNIKNIGYYPFATIEVFNRYGQKVYYSNGISTAWNGKNNEQALPAGTYYYIINAAKGIKTMAGWVAIIR